MALLTDRNLNSSIVAPAGNLAKLKSAIYYGADEVYFGGSSFNLRNQANNFSLDELAEAAEFCKKHKVKSVFLLNSFLHEKSLVQAREYIKEIKDYHFDAVMISDPGMLALVDEAGLDCERHLSTQMSTLNHLSVKFWENAGFNRIVLAREVTLEEIKALRGETSIQLECFIHGALCVAYSGRCLLSRYMSGRDANLGSCAQPCRWKFSLVESSRPGNYMPVFEENGGTEILSSKDLCLLSQLPEYVAAGIDAFKIEGRMKSVYYTANVVRIYKDALNTIKKGGDFESKLPFWLEELDLVSHRPYTEDLFNEFQEKGYYGIPYIQKAEYLGFLEENLVDGTALVSTSNPIYKDEEISCIAPITDGNVEDIAALYVEAIFDENGLEQEVAKQDRRYRIRFAQQVPERAIFRRAI